jgi:ABC-2 type transport system ATP-binding protein
MELESHPESPEMVIQVQNLIKRFDYVTALDNISINVPRGTIYGFIGPSGCGKTTTVRCMIGNYRPTEGVVKVLGRTPESFTLGDKKRIGYMPQLFILYPELSIWENLNFAASVYGYPIRRRKRLEELLDLVELSGHEKKLVRNISGGMQHRLSLATTLIHDPELIFLDEPTAGIGPVLRRKFWDYFRRLRDEGHTLFVTSQYVGEAVYFDYVGVMARGTLLMVETPDDLRYKAMGGDIVQFHASTALNSKMITDLRNLPFVSGELAFLDSQSVQLIVKDASTAIPHLLDWAEDEGIEIEAINQHVPPFDDVFIKIMEDEKAGQKRVVLSE